jgi:hypothetical protein
MSAINLLSTEKMVSLTQNWIQEERKTIAAIPQASGLLLNLDSLFKTLFVVVESDGKAEEKVRSISRQQAAIDRTHDHLFRGVFFFLTSRANFIASQGDEDGFRDLLTLRDQLYPDGLSGTNFSYDEEAGAAELLERRLTPEISAKLTKMIAYQDETKTITLLQQITLQISLANKLRELEQEKKKAEAEAEANPTPTRSDARKVRLEWIDTVRTFERSLRAARRAKTTDAATEALLLKPLREAAEEAQRKAAEDKKKDKPDPSEGEKK